MVLLTVLLLGCKPDKPPPEAPPVAEAPVASTPEPEEAPAAPPLTSQELYASCKTRVEGPEAAGECAEDADCATAGCNREVCIAKKNLMDVMTSCDVQPCFEVLDVCACTQGVCTWSVKE